MKPRTKKQFELVRLSNLLEDKVEEKIKAYAYQKANSKYGFSTGKTWWCGVCGDTHSANMIVDNTAQCDNCNCQVEIIKTNKRTFGEYYYMAYAEELYPYQVIRIFYVEVAYRKGECWNVSVIESVRQFHTEHSMDIMGRLTHYGSVPKYGEIEFRNYSYYKQDLYNPYPSCYHPDSQYLEDYQKRGCVGDIGNVKWSDLKNKLLLYPQIETLLKAKATSFLSELDQAYKIINNWNSIKICLRNKYQPYNAGIYFDYLDLLRFFQKDLRNPHYVCPSDLKQAHDIYVAKKRKHDAEMEVKRKIEKALKDREIFEELKSKFFGIQFSKGNILVKVIDTVEDYLKEGAELNHCIFTNSYYSKKDSLCLSALVDGKRTETVEISLNNFDIIQCRGYRNQNSEYHNQIISLVKENIHLIQAKCTSIKPKAKKKKLHNAAA